MLCRWLKIKETYNKQKNGSLQTTEIMSPPAQPDTSSGRVSFCTSFFRGSFTVEAALIVPVFFMAMIILLNLTDLIRIQSSVTLSLNESAKNLGMYGYTSERVAEHSPVKVWETGACIAYAQARLPTLDRVRISLLRSSYVNHTVDLQAKVTYQFPVRIAGIKQTSFFCRARVHAWTGYRESEEGGWDGSEEKMVYLTERQTVYHTHGDCSHLQISIQCTTRKGIASRRNANGGKYTPCPHCKPDYHDRALYFTSYGDRYHCDVQCQSLKRTGRLVPESAVSGLKECSRCAERR